MMDAEQEAIMSDSKPKTTALSAPKGSEWSVMHTLGERVAVLEERVSSSLATKADVVEEATRLDKRITQEVSRLDQRITQETTRLEKYITQEIASLRAEMNERFQKLEKDIAILQGQFRIMYWLIGSTMLMVLGQTISNFYS